MSSIEFDVSWRPYLQLMVSLYTDTVENYGGNCYMLQLNSNYCYLQKCGPTADRAISARRSSKSLQRKAKAHLAIRVNKEAKTISLLLDGDMVKQWKDNGTSRARGEASCFTRRGRG